MRKGIYNIFMIMLLCIYSVSLTSCEAITAQNITNIGSDEEANGNSKMEKAAIPDVMGKIISVSSNSIKVELIEQNQNDISLNSDDRKENIGKDVDDKNQKTKIGISDNMFEDSSTGIEKTLAVSDDVEISEEASMNPQSKIGNSKLSIKLLDLKIGQVVMIWFKEDTEIAQKISVM